MVRKRNYNINNFVASFVSRTDNFLSMTGNVVSSHELSFTVVQANSGVVA